MGFVLMVFVVEVVDCCRSLLDGNDLLDENVLVGNREFFMVIIKSGK